MTCDSLTTVTVARGLSFPSRMSRAVPEDASEAVLHEQARQECTIVPAHAHALE